MKHRLLFSAVLTALTMPMTGRASRGADVLRTQEHADRSNIEVELVHADMRSFRRPGAFDLSRLTSATAGAGRATCPCAL
jgi:hypothetical protein